MYSISMITNNRHAAFPSPVGGASNTGFIGMILSLPNSAVRNISIFLESLTVSHVHTGGSRPGDYV